MALLRKVKVKRYPKVEQWVAAQNMKRVVSGASRAAKWKRDSGPCRTSRAGAFVGTDMVQNYAFAGGASATRATLLRSTRTCREYRLMRESKINLNSSLVQEVW